MKTIAKTMITGMMMCVVCLNALAAGLNKPVPENCDIEDGRQFYIYNVTAEQFVNADGITLTFNNDGNPILFEYDDSNDEWKMQGVKGYLYADWENVGCEGNSNDPNTVWCVERQSSGAYYIRPSKSDPDYLWENNPDTWTGISTETGLLHPILKSGEGYIDWFIVSLEKYELFVSQRVLFNAIAELESYGVDVATYVDSYNSASLKDEYDAAYNNLLGVLKENRIKNASELNPVDVTSLYLRNADLTENWVNDGHDVPGWEMTPSSFLGMGEFDNDGFYEDNKTLGSWSPGAFSDSRLLAGQDSASGRVADQHARGLRRDVHGVGALEDNVVFRKGRHDIKNGLLRDHFSLLDHQVILLCRDLQAHGIRLRDAAVEALHVDLLFTEL